MYFDYGTENNLFQVKINNNKFITDDFIESIDITEDKLIIIFRGNKFISSDRWLKKTEIIKPEKVLTYFVDEYHTVIIEEFNRQGIIIKETSYYKAKCLSIDSIDNNRYKLILKIANKDDDF